MREIKKKRKRELCGQGWCVKKGEALNEAKTKSSYPGSLGFNRIDSTTEQNQGEENRRMDS